MPFISADYGRATFARATTSLGLERDCRVVARVIVCPVIYIRDEHQESEAAFLSEVPGECSRVLWFVRLGNEAGTTTAEENPDEDQEPRSEAQGLGALPHLRGGNETKGAFRPRSLGVRTRGVGCRPKSRTQEVNRYKAAASP